MILILLLILLLTAAYWKLAKHYNYWTDRSVRQRKQIYLLGDNSKLFLQKESIFEAVANMYNAFPSERYMGIYQMLVPVLLIKDPELIKQITIKDFDHFPNHRTTIPKGVEPLWNKNLFSLTDTAWRDMRHTLSPSFTSSKMKMMFTLIAECANEFTEHYLKKSDDNILEMKDIFTRYTNDIIASVAFGIKCDSLNERENDFFTMGMKATQSNLGKNLRVFLYLIAPRLAKILGISFFAPEVTNFFLNIIKETIKMRKLEGITRSDMVQLLLEARKNKEVLTTDREGVIDNSFATIEDSVMEESKAKKQYLTDVDIAAQALVFFFGGFESVSSLMTFAAYELTLNQDTQRKLQSEIDETLRECNGKLTYDALMKMKYMDMVISETLRKWPSAVATDRVCSKKYTIMPTQPQEKPIVLEPGDTVWIPIYGIHYDPKYFPDHEKFDPERFNDENKIKINPYTYLPFGLGPRNCIGSRFALMESKTILCYLLSKFDFCICEKTDIPIKLNRKVFQLLPENGAWIQLKPRIT